MDKFFHEFFLETPMIYTLFGSKPMSEITVVIASLEDWKEHTYPFIQDLPLKKQEKVLREIESYTKYYDLDINWMKWKQWIKQHPLPGFLFREYPTESKNLFNINMINIREVVWTLQQYYHLFNRELKMDFDPLIVALDFENKESDFWNAVFANHYLLGILYGFGERNAYFFSKEIEKNEKNDRISFLFSSPIGKQKKKSNENSIPLPSFHSYEINVTEDPVLSKYKLEKTQIKKN